MLLTAFHRKAGRHAASVLELGCAACPHSPPAVCSRSGHPDRRCGTARHGLAAARHGLRVTALDNSQAMLDMAQASANSEGLQIDVVAADLTSFEVKVGRLQ